MEKASQYQIFVNDDSPAQPGREDGKSWQSAFKCLQQAIEVAEKEGREIWVAEGIYKPTLKMNPADPRSATFLIRSGIEIIGGFSGNEVSRSPQGSPYNTVLSGDLTGNDGQIQFPPDTNAIAKLSDNSFHVVTLLGSGIERIKQ